MLDQEDEESLNEIESNYPKDTSKCCKGMFQLWLRKCDSATWDQLINALRETDLNAVASKIKGMLMSGEYTVNASAGMLLNYIACKYLATQSIANILIVSYLAME